MKKNKKFKCVIILPAFHLIRKCESDFYLKLFQLDKLEVTSVVMINRKSGVSNNFFFNLALNFVQFVESKFTIKNSPDDLAKLKKFLLERIKFLSQKKLWEDVNNKEICSADIVLNLNNIPLPNFKFIKTSYGIWSFNHDVKNENYKFQDFCKYFKQKEIYIMSLYTFINKKNYKIKKFKFNKFKFFLQTKEYAITKSLNFVFYEIKSIISKEHTQNYKLFKSNSNNFTVFNIIQYIFFSYSNAIIQKLTPYNLQINNLENFKWHLAIVSGNINNINNLEKAKVLTPPTSEFWADPCLVEHNNEKFIFFENFQYLKNKGCIAVGRLINNELKDIKNIISRKYHFSYPHVFKYKNHFYLIPETFQAQRLEIWKSKEFPYKWKLHKTFFHGKKLADTSIVKFKKNFWLFTNISNDRYNDFTSELHIFKVSSPLLEKIQPHRRNPVVTDTDNARNAGPLFYQNDKYLIRPSQAYVNGIYGNYINFNRIEKLNLDHYKEKIVRKIKPNFRNDIIGIHHISKHKNQAVIDIFKNKIK
tara:strand:+ start:5850 stop:7445 length:1596 start_codon:yes stop_codon:yes gene_type:complete